MMANPPNMWALLADWSEARYIDHVIVNGVCVSTDDLRDRDFQRTYSSERALGEWVDCLIRQGACFKRPNGQYIYEPMYWKFQRYGYMDRFEIHSRVLPTGKVRNLGYRDLKTNMVRVDWPRVYE